MNKDPKFGFHSPQKYCLVPQKPKVKGRGLLRKLQALAHIGAEPVLHLSPEGSRLILKLYADGKSVSHIACKLAMDREMVERELIRQGVIRIDGTRRVAVHSGVEMAQEQDMRQRAQAAGLVLP